MAGISCNACVHRLTGKLYVLDMFLFVKWLKMPDLPKNAIFCTIFVHFLFRCVSALALKLVLQACFTLYNELLQTLHEDLRHG